ncbi:hypothetical protein O3P69_019931 [Scylla paramamosain]|uniref:Uncharacterized protein n=1 Tax=Scylla paramamosain TaxID=85552 RepID=A0AAW0SJT5_SCYPA
MAERGKEREAGGGQKEWIVGGGRERAAGRWGARSGFLVGAWQEWTRESKYLSSRFRQVCAVTTKWRSLRRRERRVGGWVTRTSQALSEVLAQPTPTLSEMEYAIQEFDKRLAKLDEVQEELEGEVEAEELDQELDEAHAFRQESMKPRLLAEDKIRKLAAAAPGGSPVPSSVSGSQDSEAVNVKLPKLELPKFSGEITQWQSLKVFPEAQQRFCQFLLAAAELYPPPH